MKISKIYKIIFPILLLMLWHIVSELKLVAPVFLPSPMATAIALKNGFAHSNWLNLLGETTKHMLFGWLLSSIIGIIIGCLIGLSKSFQDYIQPSLEFLRPLPASAIIPIGIAFLGLTEGMVYTVVVFGSIWPVILSTVHAINNIEPRLNEVRKLLKIKTIPYIFKIALPSAYSDILSGMQISLSVALILSVTAEMLAYQNGVGTAILDAARSYRAADLYAGVIVLSLVGLISSQLLSHFRANITNRR